MQPAINIFTSKYMGIAVNYYLIKTDTGFILIDAGMDRKYSELLKNLQNSGCQPGNLKLIVLTHSDFDHAGNAAALHQVYGAPIAMHPGDVENAQKGDMFFNKQVSPLAKFIAKLLFALIGMGNFHAFTPDVLLEQNQDLGDYGWQARVIHLPGHSKGSIGILSADGDLFCGDQFENTKTPAINSLVDDPTQIQESAQKLSQLDVKIVYPGHGKPFSFRELNLI